MSLNGAGNAKSGFSSTENRAKGHLQLTNNATPERNRRLNSIFQRPARLFQSLLYGVGTADPLSIAAAIGTLLVTSPAATIVPACRAIAVDPMVSLRHE